MGEKLDLFEHTGILCYKLQLPNGGKSSFMVLCTTFTEQIFFHGAVYSIYWE